MTAALVAGSSTTGGTAPLTPAVNVQTIVSGLPDVPPGGVFAGVGPYGIIFDRSNHLLVSDAANSGFYSFGPGGSTAPTPLTTGNVQTGLAFAKNGDLFAALYLAGNIDQIDPATGAFIRQLNPPSSTHLCATSLATDPVTGDLFFGQPNSGGICSGTPGITRVENPTSASPTFVTSNPVPGDNYIGLTFARDGTLYAVQQGSDGGCAVRIRGITSRTPPTVTELACFPNFENEFVGIETVALSARPKANPTLFVAGPDGTITEIDQSTSPPTTTPLVTLGTRVDDLTIGTDGCLYATQSTGIVRITPTNGRCRLRSVNVLTTLRIRPDATDATTGQLVTLRARLLGTGHPSGQRITFTVTGANPATRIVRTDSSGKAALTYRGTHTGTDVVTATATVDTNALASNPATVLWQLPVRSHT
jgi:streptogramin lyase